MNSYKTYICLALLALSGCKNNDGNSPQTLTSAGCFYILLSFIHLPGGLGNFH